MRKAKKCSPLILHCSPSGAIERVIYALLEKAYAEQQKGKPPMLPLWLSPTQIRIIPMSDELLEKVEETAKEIESRCIRVDIDDRALTLQKKIREAEMEWIPYIVVVGKREIESGKISVRVRATKEMRNMKLEELISEIVESNKGKPFKPLPLPKHLSKRPQFYG